MEQGDRVVRRQAEISVPSGGLDGAELEALWGRYHRGRGIGDRNRLWEHYAWIARVLAGRMRSRMNHILDVSAEDMEQMAGLGLLDAIETWKDGHGAKFVTWANWKIRHRIVDELRGQDELGRHGRVWAERAERGDESRPALMAGRLSGSRRFTDCRDGDTRNEPLGVSCEGKASGLEGREEWDWFMRGLGAKDRILMTLRYRDGLTLREVGLRAGICGSDVVYRTGAARRLVLERLESRK